MISHMVKLIWGPTVQQPSWLETIGENEVIVKVLTMVEDNLFVAE
jgi:hypothetical protein